MAYGISGSEQRELSIDFDTRVLFPGNDLSMVGPPRRGSCLS